MICWLGVWSGEEGKVERQWLLGGWKDREERWWSGLLRVRNNSPRLKTSHSDLVALGRVAGLRGS